MEERRLAAIMFTDIVGYTRLMGENEERALSILEKNREIHQLSLQKNNGNLLKEIGDGMLCSFESASNAVYSAIDLIQAAHNIKELNLRIGIHIGEVIFSHRDVFGDGVNIASRIESMAIPNSVLISGKVYDEIKNKHNIKTKFIGTYTLKNDSKPREIYALTNSRLKVPSSKILDTVTESKRELQNSASLTTRKKKNSGGLRQTIIANPRIRIPLLITGMALILGSFLFINLKNNRRVKEVRQKILPKIQRLIMEGNSKQAFELALDAEQILTHDSIFYNIFSRVSRKIDLITDPPDAEIYTKFINSPDSEYRPLGYSPLKGCRVYRDYSIWKIEKPGFRTFEFLGSNYELNNFYKNTIRLQNVDSIPNNELIVPFFGWQYRPFGALALMKFHEFPNLNDFIIDKFEVTNADFKVFVDSGGYNKREYWDFPIKRLGKLLTWEDAISLFIDRTGQKGPATWEVGDYPDHQENYPVSGISWFEAMAYANFAGKTLPSVYHWMYAATPLLGDYISPSSNFNKKGLDSVGIHNGIGIFGTYDMAGNVREWCANFQAGNEKAFILGGGWNENPYTYNITFTQDPFDRSEINGFRCITYIDIPENLKEINKEIPVLFRDFSKENPIDDEGFQILLSQFKYDKADFNESKDNLFTDEGKIPYERITIDAAYGNDRLPMYLFLPENETPPYQLIIRFPSTYPFTLKNPERFIERFANYNPYRKNGRAVLFPVYNGALDRSDNKFMEKFNRMESSSYKELMIMWIKDIGRCLDYLETRSDIDVDKIAYEGVSLGAANGAIIPAVEKRIKVAVLTVAGLWHDNVSPEIDQLNYLPRINIPVLMINGRYDHIFPLESSQIPMFNLLGTPGEHKKQYIYEYGHHVPQNIIIRETLNWLDTYLGPVD